MSKPAQLYNFQQCTFTNRLTSVVFRFFVPTHSRYSIKSSTNVVVLKRTNHSRFSTYSDSLMAGRSEDRTPVRARLSTPVQTDPGAHPASCIMGTGSLSRGRVPEAWR